MPLRVHDGGVAASAARAGRLRLGRALHAEAASLRAFEKQPALMLVHAAVRWLPARPEPVGVRLRAACQRNVRAHCGGRLGAIAATPAMPLQAYGVVRRARAHQYTQSETRAHTSRPEA